MQIDLILLKYYLKWIDIHVYIHVSSKINYNHLEFIFMNDCEQSISLLFYYSKLKVNYLNTIYFMIHPYPLIWNVTFIIYFSNYTLKSTWNLD